jgi:hypothetical protein
MSEWGENLKWRNSDFGGWTFLDKGMTRRNINDVPPTFIGTFQMIPEP